MSTSAQKKDANSLWWGRILTEFIGSLVLTLVFGIVFLYNVGAAFTTSEPSKMPASIQAFIVALSVWIIYWIGSKVSRHHAQLNPIVSIVHYGMIANYYNTKYKEQKESYTGRYLLEFLWAIIAQLVGVVLGTLLIWLFGGLNIDDIQNSIERDGNPFSIVPTSTQVARAIIGELLGTIALILIAYYMKTYTQASGNRPSNYSAYGKLIGFFYFLYMLIFWLHTKLTVDWIRGGIFCLFALSDKTDHCSPLSSGTADGSLYLVIAGIQIFISIITFIIILYKTK